MCCHDPRVGGRLVRELTAAELYALGVPTLDEACAVVQRPGAEGVGLCVEVKVDPRRPDETADPETLVRAVVAVVEARGVRERTLLMSFDWCALVAARELEPRLATVALAAPGTVEGDVVAGAHAVGASVLGPLYGSGEWGTPGFRWYLTPAMVEAAHEAGMRVVPWTVNEPEAIEQVLALGVDGIVSDYPDRVGTIMAWLRPPPPSRG
jgi:glycerophosphoryl diester phosphodiesterase